jgi:RimJ/RimL family protein N-acetyltransferase
MLRGEKVALRARIDADVEILDEELYTDVLNASRADVKPWTPLAPGGPASPHRIREPDDKHAPFSIVDLETHELAGECSLWSIDTHNRLAHIGVSLRPSHRGRGLGTDAVAVLCHYAFVVRSLHRLQIETLADNVGMINAATKNGFTPEGKLRSNAWVFGEFHDEVIFGLLLDEWLARRGPAAT